MVSEKRKRDIKAKMQAENRRHFFKMLTRIVILPGSTGIIWLAIVLIFFTIWDPIIVNGYCYKEELVIQDGYHRLQLSYRYTYEGVEYDQLEVELISNFFRERDSLLIEISKSDPNFHTVLRRTNEREVNIYDPVNPGNVLD